MDYTVERLVSSEECEQYALNVAADYPALAIEARRKALVFKAETHGPVSEAEFCALQSIYACEQALVREFGRGGSGPRPWPMVKKLGILPALEKLAADKKQSALLSRLLAAMGLADMTYESVILRFADAFSPSIVKAMQSRQEPCPSA